MIFKSVLAIALSLSFFVVDSVDAKAAKKKPAKVVEVVDWSARASAELESAKIEPAVPVAKTKKKNRVMAKPAAGETAAMEAPQVGLPVVAASRAATVTAEVETTRSVIERSSLRFTFLFEPYRPNGTAVLGSGQELAYSELPTSVLGQVDLRWLPLQIGEFAERNITLGGYTAGGFARTRVPLVAASGFRYDDVALNSFRYEGGLASGIALAEKWNLEARLGVGRSSVVQTSRYSEVVGSFDRPFVIGALDLSFYLASRFAFVASVAKRSPIGDGSGALVFDPLTVSGGFLVQVR